MVGWIEIYETTKNKLDRDLVEQEVEYLKWLYAQHLVELEQNECIK